ncbi:TRAP transporter small permease subunit [Pseudohalocynthiibacter sp. F2068]|jgi:TRAP-type transport system small permease protein|uniref:TRAP transporter small permease n=1 Tax=Pseudohalocynthiibacter sp. F2068 TaxID=2926418 RepID=UPI001FF2D69D|nr:TRAP transporter small permease subunit [Pseudohalocynthiibacter sp. F2068]MCK0100722.1 TRAP transporter small permease subunit [Pseudohalocynthiibacter sp. F2068]
MSIWSDALGILTAMTSGDSWTISKALGNEGAWIIGTLATLAGGYLVMRLYRAFPVIDRHFERSVMVYSYLLIAAIIFVEVFRRFVLSQQAPWSTTLPPVLFLIMTWFGCSYNIRLRTHLAFSEFRTSMRRPAQMFCLSLDAVLWIGFCVIVVVTSTRVAANSAANFQILAGTDNFMQWWYLVSVPVAFILMAGRVLENWTDDLNNYRSGEPLISQAVIGGDV